MNAKEARSLIRTVPPGKIFLQIHIYHSWYWRYIRISKENARFLLQDIPSAASVNAYYDESDDALIIVADGTPPAPVEAT